MNRRARQLTSSPRRWALRPLPAALMATMMPMAAWSFDVGQVVHGQVTSSTNGTATNVKVLTDTAVINTKDSSIRANESVSIDMLSGRSSLLVRDTSYDPTYLLGSLQSNGRVFFLNPNGIVIGNGFRADVGALVASTLNLADDDFKKKKYRFSSVPGDPGAIVEKPGSLIHARETVAYVAPQVTQQGTIVAPRVGLAAGTEALLDLDGDGLIFLQVGNAQEAATRLSQLGTIVADGGTVDIQARAREALADTVLNVDGIIRARSLGTREGRVVIDGGSSGVTAVNGQIDVSGDDAGERGGQISVLGDKVGLFGTASLDASGQTGGGTVLVGGNYQGSGNERKASRTFIGRDTSIKSNAIEQGNGGKVVVWSDEVTRYFGNIEARGGQHGGNGGFVEVSGKESLTFMGKINLSAPLGTGGVLLLDPRDITLAGSGGAVFADQTAPAADVAFAAGGASDIVLDVDDLDGVAELRLQATRDILFTANLTMNTGNDVVLSAGRNISLGTSTLRVQGSGTITLTANAADGSGSEVDGLGSITTGSGGLIRADAGLVTLSAGSDGINVNTRVTNLSASTTGSGDVTLSNNGNLTFATTTSNIGGDLNVTVTNAGSINNTAAVVVAGDASFETSSVEEDIALSNVTIGGTVSLITDAVVGTANASISSTSAINLGTSHVEGNLSVTAGGSITQSDALSVSGNTTLAVSTAASDIVLDNAGNSLAGNVILGGTQANVRDLSIRNTNNNASLPINLSSLSNLRDLTLHYAGNVGVIDLPTLSLRNITIVSGRTSSGGDNAITDAGIITASGNASFTATGTDRDIVVNQLDVAGTLAVNTTGSAGGATVVNAKDVELATSSVGGNLSITSNSHITQVAAATLTVGGTTSLQVATNDSDILLGNAGNSMAGAITFTGSAARIRDVAITNVHAAAAVPTLSGLTNLRNLAIDFSAANVTLGALDIDGNLSVTSGGATGITDTGILTVAGTASFATTAANATIVVNQLAVDGTIAVNTTGATGHATIVNDAGVNLAASSVGGNLAVTATTGNIADNAPVSAGGNASYTASATGATITVDDQTVIGTFTVNTTGTGAHATIVNAGAVALNASGVGGNLTVTANSGNITDNGTVTVGGNASYTTAASNADITVDTQAVTGSFTANTTGATGNATIVNATGVALAASSVGGDLGVTATTGNITDSGVITVGGNASYTTSAADASITANEQSVAGTIAVNTSGAAGNVVIVNAQDVELATSSVGGTLAITSDSHITQSTGATLSTGGNVTLTVQNAASDILLGNAGNSLGGTVSIGGNQALVRDLALRSSSAQAALGSLAGLTGLRDLTVHFSSANVALTALTASGNLDITSGGAGGITDTGTVSVLGNASFTTTAADADITVNQLAVTGDLAVSTTGTTGNATIVNATAVNLLASNVGGNLNATATTGNITDAGTITVGGNASYTTSASGATITANQQAVAGTIAVSTTGPGANATIVNSTAVVLATSGVGGNLSATATTGSISDTGVVTVGGNASYTASAAGATITVDQQAVTGSFALSTNGAGADVAITNATGVALAASTVGGDLDVTATTGNISDTGIVGVAGNASYTTSGTGATITVDQQNVTGTFALSTTGTGANATIVNDSSKDVELATSNVGGTLTVTSGSHITQASGATLTTGGAVTLTVLSNDSDILLGSGGNSLGGAINFAGDQTLVRDLALGSNSASASIPSLASLTDLRSLTINFSAADVTLSALNITGNFNVTSGGSTGITTAGLLTVGGNVSFTTTSSNADIVANQLAVTGTISANTTGSTGHATLVNATGVNLATSNVGGNLSATATTGNLTDSGTITVGGNASYATAASGATITANQQAVTGTFALSTNGPGAHATIVNATAVALATSGVGGNLSATAATGNITDSGIVTVGGNASYITSASGASITLDQQAVTGTFALSTSGASGHATITNASGVTLLASTVGGNLGVTATTGNIADSGTIVVGGNARYTTAASGATITVDNQDVSGTFAVNTAGAGADATVVNVKDVELATSDVGGTLRVTSSSDITQAAGATLVTGGDVILTVLTAGSDIELGNGGNAFGGAFIVAGDQTLVRDLALGGSTLTSLPSLAGLTNLRDLTLNFSTADIVLPTLNITGNLSVTSGGLNGISATQAMVVAGNASFTTTQANADIVATDLTVGGALSANTNGVGGNATLVNATAIDLAASDIGGNLSVTATTGNITDSGTVIVDGTASYTTQGNDSTITVNQQDVGGAVALSTTGSNANVVVVNARALQLGSSTIGGNLDVTAITGDLSDGGTVTVGGTARYATSASNASIVLDQQNVAGTVALSTVGAAGHASIVNAHAQGLNLASSTVGGNLSAVANSGNLTDVGLITVGGQAVYTTNASNATIVVNQQAVSGGIAVNTTGAAGHATIDNTLGVALGSSSVGGNLSVTAGSGAITQNGAVSVNGSTVLAATGQAITLTNSGNNFSGNVSATGAVVQITDANALNATLNASGAATLIAGGNLGVSGSAAGLTTTTTGAGNTSFGTTNITGNLSTTSAGAVGQSGALTVSGTTVVSAAGQTITLNNASNNFTGNVTATGSTIQITDVNALNAALNASGAATLSAGGNLGVSGAAAGLTTTTTGSGTTAFGITNVTGNLSATSAGAVSQSGALTVSGTTMVSAAGQAITLNNGSNDFAGNVSATGSTIQITDDNALSAVLNASGAATLIAGGNLGVSGSAAGLTTTTTDSGTTAFGITNVTGNLSATSAGAVGQTGALTVSGTTTVLATGQAITLTNATNNFTGNVSATGSAIQITDVNALNAALNASGAATLIAGGNLGVSGSAAGLTTTTTGAGTTVFGTTNVTGNLVATSAGAVSQSGALAISGTTSVTAPGQSITLTDTGNDFSDTVTAAGSTVRITDGNALNAVLNASGAATLIAGGNLGVSGTATGLTTTTTGSGTTTFGATTVTGNLAATSAGNIQDTGTVAVSGTSSLTATGNNATITVDQLAATGSVDVHTTGPNGHATIANASALTLDAGDVQGSLSASAQGTLVLTDAVHVTGGNFIHLRAAGANSDITLAQALTSGSGEINIRADRHVALNAPVTTTGRVLAQAGGNITQGAGNAVSGGQIGLIAGGSATGLNLVGGSTVLVKAGQNITGQISADTAGLQSASGLINVDTSVNTVSAQAGSSITIDNDRALTVGATAGGSVAITANGALTVAPVGAVTIAASGSGVPTGKAFEVADATTAQAGLQTGTGAGSTLNLASGSSNDDIILNGAVTAHGGGAITASGKVRINSDLNLTQGTLNIIANASPTATLRQGVFSSQQAQIRVFEGVVTQGGGRIVTGAGSTLVVKATNNGSIYLTSDNDIRGGISAVSGTSGEVGDARFLGTTPISVSEISIKSTEINVAGKPDGTVPGPVGSAKGLEGDSIVLETSKISTHQFDGTIRGRMPFDKTLQIVAASMPSLSLKIPASALGGGGNPLFVGGSSTTSWIQTRLGSDALGGLVTVVPSGVGQDKAIVFLGGIDPVPVYPGSGKPTEIRVFYNGLATATPEEEAALSSVLSIIEDQRRARFEETVRTENVSSRLRSGVIAEVGAGRPATEGSESILMPPSCTPAAGAMTCQ